MPELYVCDLTFTHVGSHLVVDCPTEQGPRPYAGVLFDVAHRPGGPSWLSFRVDGTPVVLVVDDPSTTTVLLEGADRGAGAGAVPAQTDRSGEPLRQHSQ